MKDNKLSRLSNEKLIGKKKFVKGFLILGIIILIVGLGDLIYSLVVGNDDKVKLSGVLVGLAACFIFYGHLKETNNEINQRDL